MPSHAFLKDSPVGVSCPSCAPSGLTLVVQPERKRERRGLFGYGNSKAPWPKSGASIWKKPRSLPPPGVDLSRNLSAASTKQAQNAAGATSSSERRPRPRIRAPAAR